jgi:hypothetical protein
MGDKLKQYNLNTAQFYSGVVLSLYSLSMFYGYLGTKLIALPFTYFVAPIMFFTGGIWAMNRLENNEANNLLKIIYAAFFFFVGVIDVVWNQTAGRIIYKKFRLNHWLFTNETKFELGNSDMRDRAVYWAETLNHIDPKPHIDIDAWIKR